MPNLEPLVALASEMSRWRHEIHSHPELGFEETRTSQFVARLLASFGIEVHERIGGTGVVGVIHGAAPGPAIGLRADMDALPMSEQTGLPYESQNAGRFHGCGHDGHTATLLGAARHLSQHQPARGRVHLIFQPAEETGAGASRMIGDGLFERFPCDEVYGFHNLPLLPAGKAGVRVGPTLSSLARFDIKITGVGGHAAAPHTTTDPLQTAARLAIEISSFVGRYIDPLEPAMISLGRLVAGTSHNIIPSTAALEGTIRTFSTAVQISLLERLRASCAGLALSSDCHIDCRVHENVPPCVNAPEGAASVVAACGDILGPENVLTDIKPYLFSDDFAFMLERCPGAFYFLGQKGAMCHHPTFDFDDGLLPVGSSIFARIVERTLGPLV